MDSSRENIVAGDLISLVSCLPFFESEKIKS